MTDALPCQPHSETSRAAADALGDATTLRRAVYEALVEHGPMTDEQLQDALVMNPSTERPRRVELVGLGLVADSGKRGRTRAGCVAVLWSAVDAAAARPVPVRSWKSRALDAEAKVAALEAENVRLRGMIPAQRGLPGVGD